MNLVQSYHHVYDIKDEASAKGDEAVRYAAYLTLQEMARLMKLTGVPVPDRFDA